MTSSTTRGGLLAVLSVCALASAAVAGPARFIEVRYPGATETQAIGINPAGDVVGSYKDAIGQHGFVLRRGTFSSIDIDGAAWTQAYAISPKGDIVGQYGLKGDANTYGFFLRDGTFYKVEVPDQPSTMPYGISPEGAIAGCVHGGKDGMHGFVLTAAGDSSLQGPKGSMHTGINALGDVTGYGVDPSNTGSDSSYVIRNGVTDWFRYPDSLFTRARGISSTGDVVGVYQEKPEPDGKPGKVRGFLLRHGELVSIDVPGATTTRAFGTNAVGDIVGSYVVDQVTHGFLMSRRPE